MIFLKSWSITFGNVDMYLSNTTNGGKKSQQQKLFLSSKAYTVAAYRVVANFHVSGMWSEDEVFGAVGDVRDVVDIAQRVDGPHCLPLAS